MFCTGIENSVPTIQGGKVRVDEMESCGHYARWQEDFALVQDLGIEYLRYGPPIHKTPTWVTGKYDWGFADETFGALKQANITPIVDLCHFGVPDFIGNFQNPDFPVHLPAPMPEPLPSASRGSSSIRRSTRCTFVRCSRPATAGGTSSYGE